MCFLVPPHAPYPPQGTLDYLYMRAFPKWMVGTDQLERMGAEKVGADVVAGVPCDRWVSVRGPSETTFWMWNGIQLGYKNKLGDMEFGERAVSVQLDAEIPGEVFQVPPGVELEEMVLPGTPLLQSLESQQVPAASSSPLPALDDSFRFPTIEPFKASRMWNFVLAGDDLELDVDRGVTFMGVEMMAMGEASRAVERLVGERPERTGASARMDSEIGPEESLWWRAVPPQAPGVRDIILEGYAPVWVRVAPGFGSRSAALEIPMQRGATPSAWVRGTEGLSLSGVRAAQGPGFTGPCGGGGARRA